MQRGQRAKHAECDGHRFLRRQGAAGQAAIQGLAVEELHGQEDPVRRFVHFEDLTDMRMVDARCRARFAPEARSRRVVGQAGDHLQGDVAAQPLVAGHIDHAHAAAAQRPHHDVAADVVARIQLAHAAVCHRVKSL